MSGETEHEHEARIRQLERDHSSALARLDGVEGQQRATWGELRRLSREGRDEFAKLRQELKEDREARHSDNERLVAAIYANKVAQSITSGGTKAIAWVVGVLIGLASLITAIGLAVKRLFFTG